MCILNGYKIYKKNFKSNNQHYLLTNCKIIKFKTEYLHYIIEIFNSNSSVYFAEF